MTGTTTVTTKGQVVIPKAIRDHFGIKPHDKMRFRVEKGVIVADREPTAKEMAGFLKSKVRGVTRKQMREAVKEAVVEKFNKKMSQYDSD